MKLTERLRSASKSAHSLSDALVNARLVVLFTDRILYARALACFYFVFKALEDALDRAFDKGAGKHAALLFTLGQRRGEARSHVQPQERGMLLLIRDRGRGEDMHAWKRLQQQLGPQISNPPPLLTHPKVRARIACGLRRRGHVPARPRNPHRPPRTWPDLPATCASASP